MAATLVGAAGERTVGGLIGVAPNRAPLAGINRIPDFINALTQTTYEVKDTSYLSYTAQLRDMADWAITNGYRFQLWVNENTVLSSGIIDARNKGLIEIHRFTWP